MNMHIDGAALRAAQEIRALTRAEKCDEAANAIYLAGDKRVYSTVRGVEHMTEQQLDATPIAGTVLEPAYAHFATKGYAFEPSLGGAQRFFGLTDRELHELLCGCHKGEVMCAMDGAQYFTFLATGIPCSME